MSFKIRNCQLPARRTSALQSEVGSTVNCQLFFKKAFTLLELSISISILVSMGLMIASIYFSQFGIFSRQSSAIDTQIQNTIAIDEIVNQIKESERVFWCYWNEVTVPAGDCGTTNNLYPSASRLILRIWPKGANGESVDPATLSSGCITPPTCTYDVFRYYVNPQKQLIKELYKYAFAPGQMSSRPHQDCYSPNAANGQVCYKKNQILGTNVDSINFQYLDANGDAITCDLTQDSCQQTITTIIITIKKTTKPIKGPPITTTTTRKATIRNI